MNPRDEVMRVVQEMRRRHYREPQVDRWSDQLERAVAESAQELPGLIATVEPWPDDVPMGDKPVGIRFVVSPTTLPPGTKLYTIPPGYTLVPIEPTEEMLNAAVDKTNAGGGMSWTGLTPQMLFRNTWKAMLIAAPKYNDEDGSE